MAALPRWYCSFTLVLVCSLSSCAAAHTLKRRWLIFPRQSPTRHQFIGGIGIPADLDYESLVVGHVLKAEFFLPYNASVFRENPYLPEYKKRVQRESLTSKNFHRTTRRSKLRWDIYAYIIDRLNSYGYNGKECLLRAICETNSLHFERNFNVFAELLHLLLSPTTSRDAAAAASEDFVYAEKLGRFGASGNVCSVYECKLLLLDLISEVMHVKC